MKTLINASARGDERRTRRKIKRKTRSIIKSRRTHLWPCVHCRYAGLSGPCAYRALLFPLSFFLSSRSKPLGGLFFFFCFSISRGSGVNECNSRETLFSRAALTMTTATTATSAARRRTLFVCRGRDDTAPFERGLLISGKARASTFFCLLRLLLPQPPLSFILRSEPTLSLPPAFASAKRERNK